MDSLQDIENYVYAVASSEPTPGGGSVAGVIGGLAAALGSMVANFTIGKKKYLEHEIEAKKTAESLNGHIRRLLDLAQKDIDTYSVVAKAYALPKSTETEKNLREKAIENASEIAIKPPIEMLKMLQQVANILKRLADFGNRNLDSDMAEAAILTQAAVDSSYFCAYANIPFIKDKQKTELIINQFKSLRHKIQDDTQYIISIVAERMNVEL